MATIENIETSTERKEQLENMKDLLGGSFFFIPPPKEKIEAREDRDDEKRNRESVGKKLGG